MFSLQLTVSSYYQGLTQGERGVRFELPPKTSLTDVVLLVCAFK